MFARPSMLEDNFEFLSPKAWSALMKVKAEEISFAKVTKAFSKLSEIAADKAI